MGEGHQLSPDLPQCPFPLPREDDQFIVPILIFFYARLALGKLFRHAHFDIPGERKEQVPKDNDALEAARQRSAGNHQQQQK